MKTISDCASMTEPLPLFIPILTFLAEVQDLSLTLEHLPIRFPELIASSGFHEMNSIQNFISLVSPVVVEFEQLRASSAAS